MSESGTLAALNEAFAAECASLLSHLHQSQPFVSWLAAGDQPIVARMIDQEEQHRRWLFDAIAARDGTPPPMWYGAETAAVAYLNLHALLPRIIADKKRLISAYERLNPRLSSDAGAASLAARILDRQRGHLAELERIHAAAPSGAVRTGK